MKRINKAFTLVEVLITLAIIGVVAALTIPTVITNYQKKMYVTQLKKSYNNIINGFRTYMASQGVTKLSDTRLWEVYDGINAKACQDELRKIFKIDKIYYRDEIPDNYPKSYKFLNYPTEQDTVSSLITLADGSSIVEFDVIKGSYRAFCKNGRCSSLKELQDSTGFSTKYWERAGGIDIDVNGPKGPNIVGRDLFSFEISSDGMLYPYGGADLAAFYLGITHDDAIEESSYYWNNSNSGRYTCNTDKKSEGKGCAGRIIEEGWEMKY